MTVNTPTVNDRAVPEVLTPSMGARVLSWSSSALAVAGIGFVTPVVRLVRGEDRRGQLALLWRQVGVPLLAILLFLGAWDRAASTIETSLGRIPGPAAVWEQARALRAEHVSERGREAAFYARQSERNAARLAADPAAAAVALTYTGRPTYVDQIVTSLRTVFTGFLIASLIAIPVGILSGLSPTINAGISPFIQIFRPVSPLAWLPIVTMIVSAVYVSADPLFAKSFITSAVTVALCSLWPTLINTTHGVSSIDRDLLNVARVLRLNWTTRLFKVIIPSSLPLIFMGLRLSLGVGWMVLIAAEMLAQNPGLGKFIWDEFQNGSSDSLARIMVAVFTIGIIGFVLDRLMQAIHNLVDYGASR
jgi:nitrate/nitrite transport system permease protein